MFKYPPPWQVLCSNLEKREQVSVNGEGSRRSIIPKDDLITNNKNEYFAQTKVEDLATYQTSDRHEAYSTKKSEEDIHNSAKINVFQTHTTNESDLFTDIYVNEERTYITENQSLKTADTTLNTSAPDPTMDRVTRSLIFSLSSSKSINGSQDDLINSIPEEGQEADKRRDVWVSSPDRNAKLKVLREEQRFEIRSHRPETSPSKLFTDNDEEYDEKIKLKSRELTPEKVTELEKERRDIIKKQSLRNSLDVEDLTQIQDKNESTKRSKEVNGTSGGQGTENVDTEQINFEAARKQFVMMEKKQNSIPISPHTQTRPPRLSSRLLYNKYEYSDFTKQKDPFILEQDVKTSRNNSVVTQELNGKNENDSIHFKQSFEGLFVDASVQEKPREVNREAVTQEIEGEKESIANLSDETPIEREIRLALQREASLRKERGIQHQEESNEMIEIQKYTVLAKSSETEKLKKNKDRTRTSLFVQREIEKEAQREADLQTEGKVAGLYDKGNTQEIEERKKLFEGPDVVSTEPQITIIKTTWKEIVDTQDSKHQVDSEYTNKTTDWTAVDTPLPYSVRTNWKPTPMNMYRTRRLSADNILDVYPPKDNSAVQETSQETLILHSENVHNDPQKSDSPFQVNNAEEENDQRNKIPQASKPAELHGAELRRSRSNLIEEEIRQTLERDRELREQRRKSGFYPVTSSNDEEQTSSSSAYNQYRKSETENFSSWSPAPWKSTPSTDLPSNIMPSLQMFTPKRYPRFAASETDSSTVKRQDNW